VTSKNTHIIYIGGVFEGANVTVKEDKWRTRDAVQSSLISLLSVAFMAFWNRCQSTCFCCYLITLQTTSLQKWKRMAWSGSHSQFQQFNSSSSVQRWDKSHSQRKCTGLSDDRQGNFKRVKQEPATTNGNQRGIVKIQDVNQASLNVVIIHSN
jgi:hypothetical protein